MHNNLILKLRRKIHKNHLKMYRWKLAKLCFWDRLYSREFTNVFTSQNLHFLFLKTYCEDKIGIQLLKYKKITVKSRHVTRGTVLLKGNFFGYFSVANQCPYCLKYWSHAETFLMSGTPKDDLIFRALQFSINANQGYQYPPQRKKDREIGWVSLQLRVK